MLSPMPAKSTVLNRNNLLWIALSLLVVGQLVAFWMLCSQQVRQAHARVATIHAQQAEAPGRDATTATAGTPRYVVYR